MARLTGPLLPCYQNALRNWRYTDFIIYEEIAARWLRKELRGYSQRQFSELLHKFVAGGGEVDQVVETRPEWSMHSHHYDLRPVVEGRKLYVETRLIYDDPNDPDDPIILIVNIHPA